MPIEKLLPLDIQPGVSRNGTKYQNRGRWYDSQFVRWVERQILRPIGGWKSVKWAQESLVTDSQHTEGFDYVTGDTIVLSGEIRGSTVFKDTSAVAWAGLGTHTDAYRYADGDLISLVPYQDLNPTAGSWADASVTVHVDGYKQSGGWGRGNWGRGAWGRGTGALTIHDPDMWTMDNMGATLLGCFTANNTIYYSNGSGKFKSVPNAPFAKAIVVSPERFLFALGAGGDPRRLDWSDQGDITEWDFTVSSAGSFILATRGNVQGGKRTRRQTLIWTDVDLHAATFIGGQLVYGFEQLGDNCGIIGPHAAAVVGDIAYWMSYGRFFVYDGGVKPLPCDVLEHVFANLDQPNRAKVTCFTMTQFDEVWWYYPVVQSELEPNEPPTRECRRYVVYNYRDKTWYIGKLNRGTGEDRGVFENPLMVATDGVGNGTTDGSTTTRVSVLYEHELAGIDTRVNEADTSPTASPWYGKAFVESGPIEIGVGDQLARVQQIVPDIKTLGETDTQALGDAEVLFFHAFYPTTPETQIGPFSLTNPTSVRFMGRQVRVKIREVNPSPWRAGLIRLAVLLGGRR